MPPDLTQPLAAFPHALALPPVPRAPAPVPVFVRPPGSKSLTNRALLLAALAAGESTLTGALVDADDAQRMLAAVQTLGAKVSVDGTTVRITGVGGRWKVPADGVTIDLNNAGTATRFLAASVLASSAPITVTGNPRMQQRPIGELIATLERLGVKAEYLGTPGCPPVRLTPPSAVGEGVGESTAGRTVEIPTTQSSQFISALLLVAAALPGGLTVRLTGEITSASYIRMTIGQLDQLGVPVKFSDDLRVIRVTPPEGGLRGFTTDIEPDASAACFWWAAGALRPDRRIFVDALPAHSLQGDAAFPSVLESMGCAIHRQGNAVAVVGPEQLRPVMADLKDMPDAGPALSVVCAYATGRSVLRGVRTLRVKETDRIAAIATELAKIGSTVTGNLNNDPDAMAVDPIALPKLAPNASEGMVLPPPATVAFDTYDDHRMAMSLALVSLRRHGITINDPQCVAKTYPNYWQHWHRAFLS